MKSDKKAVVLLSGGIDSVTVLYWAINRGYKVHCLIIDYNQRHKIELKSAKKIAKLLNVPYNLIKLNFPWKGSALLDKNIKVPKNRKIDKSIPITYVPARNSIFLTIAASYAETIGAKYIFIGANIVDYSGYPDCRPNFLRSMEGTINKGTKQGVKGRSFKIKAPLIKKSKEEIIAMGNKFGVPYELTWSCYEGGTSPCGKCDSCRIRKKAFLIKQEVK